MSLDVALHNARSGLAHVNRAMAQSADNVANAGTEGFTRKVVEGRAAVAGGQAFGVRSDDAARDVDQALLAEIASRRAAAAGAATRERALEGVEAAHGTVADGDGIGDLVAKLSDAFVALRDDPGDSGRQRAAAGAAGLLATRVGEVAEAIGTARQQAQDGMATEIGTLNEGLRRIAALTTLIRAEKVRGGEAAALEDQRDAAIGGLSESLEMRAIRAADGGLTLVARGGLVLPLDERRDAFGFAAATTGPEAWHGAGGVLPGVTMGGVDVTDRLSGGRLAEQAALRDRTLPRFQAELDVAAANVAARLEVQGLRLFTRADGTVPDPAQDYVAGRTLGFANTFRINPTVAADPSLLRDGTHDVAAGERGATAFARNPGGGPAGFVALIDRVIHHAFGREVAAGTPQPAFATAGLGPDGSLTSSLPPDRTLTGFARELTAAQTAERASATGARAAAAELRDGLQARFAERSGVDTDAEMAAIVQFQNSYAANARVIGSVQAMWDALLAAVR